MPAERFYRLDLPVVSPPDPMRAGTLRVLDLQLGTALDSDRLLCQDGVRLEARSLSRWVAPLDRLVTESLVLSLSRARVCELVKSSADPGLEDWTLHGRIVDFVEAEGAGGPEARVAIELWLTERGELVFHEEFDCVEPILPGAAGDGGGDLGAADQAVAALSRGLSRVVTQVVDRMHGRNLFAAVRQKAQAAGVDAGLDAAKPVR
ncbi:MAG: ABC-type transport auxiliary lipoprotein family protein [Planctomycetota bacterium]